MGYAQGEVIDIKGTKVVYIAMKIKKYTAVDLNDATHVYSCKGGKSTGEFRHDLVEVYFANEQKKAIAKALKQAEDFKYKALEIGQMVIMKDGNLKFVLKHKRTKLLSMDLNGDVWDSHYGAIVEVPKGTIKDENLEINRKFNLAKEMY